MLGLLSNGSAGLVSSGMGLAVVAIAYGVFMLRTGGPNGWPAIALGAATLVVATVFGALARTWQASAPQDSTSPGERPYDGPPAPPRYEQYARMIDPDRERPRDY